MGDIRSDARATYQDRFADLPIGAKFRVVNSVIGAPTPKAVIWSKVTTNSALCPEVDELIVLRPEVLVEVMNKN